MYLYSRTTFMIEATSIGFYQIKKNRHELLNCNENTKNKTLVNVKN